MSEVPSANEIATALNAWTRVYNSMLGGGSPVNPGRLEELQEQLGEVNEDLASVFNLILSSYTQKKIKSIHNLYRRIQEDAMKMALDQYDYGDDEMEATRIKYALKIMKKQLAYWKKYAMISEQARSNARSMWYSANPDVLTPVRSSPVVRSQPAARSPSPVPRRRQKSPSKKSSKKRSKSQEKRRKSRSPEVREAVAINRVVEPLPPRLQKIVDEQYGGDEAAFMDALMEEEFARVSPYRFMSPRRWKRGQPLNAPEEYEGPDLPLMTPVSREVDRFARVGPGLALTPGSRSKRAQRCLPWNAEKGQRTWWDDRLKRWNMVREGRLSEDGGEEEDMPRGYLMTRARYMRKNVEPVRGLLVWEPTPNGKKICLVAETFSYDKKAPIMGGASYNCSDAFDVDPWKIATTGEVFYRPYKLGRYDGDQASNVRMVAMAFRPTGNLFQCYRSGVASGGRGPEKAGVN